MIRKMMFIFSILFFVCFAIFAQEIKIKDDRLIKIDEDDFVFIAASGSMMEIELGKLAQERSESERIKDLGERMVRDHSIASDELKDIAQRNHIQLPDSMLGKHIEYVKKLSQLSGSEFDEAYTDFLLEDHKENKEKFEGASEDYENQEVRSWVRKHLRTLQQHEELVKSIKDNTDQ
jgi:putative membrane protein